MPDKKKELNEAEMEQATGGGGSVNAEKAENRRGLEGEGRGVIEDPLGPPTSTSGLPQGNQGQVKS